MRRSSGQRPEKRHREHEKRGAEFPRVRRKPFGGPADEARGGEERPVPETEHGDVERELERAVRARARENRKRRGRSEHEESRGLPPVPRPCRRAGRDGGANRCRRECRDAAFPPFARVPAEHSSALRHGDCGEEEKTGGQPQEAGGYIASWRRHASRCYQKRRFRAFPEKIAEIPLRSGPVRANIAAFSDGPERRPARRPRVLLPEGWLSGRRQRFAKSSDWVTGPGGSNPPPSANFFIPAIRRTAGMEP